MKLIQAFRKDDLDTPVIEQQFGNDKQIEQDVFYNFLKTQDYVVVYTDLESEHNKMTDNDLMDDMSTYYDNFGNVVM